MNFQSASLSLIAGAVSVNVYPPIGHFDWDFLNLFNMCGEDLKIALTVCAGGPLWPAPFAFFKLFAPTLWATARAARSLN